MQHYIFPLHKQQTAGDEKKVIMDWWTTTETIIIANPACFKTKIMSLAVAIKKKLSNIIGS